MKLHPKPLTLTLDSHMEDRPRLTHTTLGGLNVHFVDGGNTDDKPSLVVVLCHGYGAPGTDLVGLAAELFTAFPSLQGRVRFVFPEAPNTLANIPFAGRAWWDIDMAALEAALQSGSLRDMRVDVPKLPPARRMLAALVDEVLRGTNLGYDRLVLGGFSQGSMLATDLALRLEEAPALLAVLSGTLFDLDGWTKAAPRRRNLSVLQSHGRQDPVLPFAGAEALRDLLNEAELDVTFLPFEGGHTISEATLIELGRRLEALTA